METKEGTMAATLTTRRNAKKKADPADAEKLLTVQQVLAKLTIGMTHLYALMKNGELPYVDFGRRCRRFEPADVEALKKKLRKVG